MKIYCEKNLTDFEFWGGAVANAEQLTYNELKQVEAILEDTYFDGIDETTINDIFWFDFDTICEWLGLSTDENGDIVRED